MGKKILVIAILLMGLALRLHKYAIYPQRGASSDEYSYSFLGVSLLTRGIPETWSNVSGYKNKWDLTIRGIYFPMVNPYFDHPPLNGLLVGGWALMRGESSYEKVETATIRLVPIFLSCISALLLYLFARRVFGATPAVWALLIFEVATIFVMNQRVVFAENVITPLMLGALYLYTTPTKMNTSRAIALGILSGLAIWTKEFGIIVWGSMLFLCLADHQKRKHIVTLIGIFVLFVAAYIAYGYAYDGNVFWTILGTQSDSRRIGPETLMFLFTTPVIVNKVYMDGWYMLGLLSLFISFIDYKKYKLIIVPFFLYLLILLFAIDKQGEMGWYMIPLYPYMAMAIAAHLYESMVKKTWYVFLMLLLVGMHVIQSLFAAHFGLVPMQFRIFLALLFAPLALAFAFDTPKAVSWLTAFYFYVCILCTAILTLTYIHPA